MECQRSLERDSQTGFQDTQEDKQKSKTVTD